MKPAVTLWVLVSFCYLCPAGFAAEGHAGAEEQEAIHGLTPAAVEVFHLGPFVVTNSMISILVVAVMLIGVAQAATREVKIVPAGLQNFVEWLVEGLFGFFGGILGKEWTQRTFWFFATLFIFIMFANWFGVIPGVGSVGWGVEDAQGHWHLTEPWFRGVNADLNMTASMALIFFVLWTVWSIQANGIGGFIKHIFGGGGGQGVMGMVIAFIFLVVGVIEVFSILLRPVALLFRLYGNIFAGENILESMATIVPWLGWLIPVPFYFLELLVGIVQAVVFALLAAVFTSLMLEHHEAPGVEERQRH